MRCYVLLIAVFLRSSNTLTVHNSANPVRQIKKCTAQKNKRGKQKGSSDAVVAYYDQVNFGVSYVEEPEPTLLEHIKDEEVPDDLPKLPWLGVGAGRKERGVPTPEYDMIARELKDWNVSVMIYDKFFKRDGVHSAVIAVCGAWDAGTVMALCNAYQKYGARGAILDIGGNIGGYTLPLARCLKDAGSTDAVIAVEADPNNNRHLRAGVKFNELDNVHLYEYAVGAGQDADRVAMRQGRGNHGMVSVAGDLPSGVNRGVPITTIDAILLREARGSGSNNSVVSGSKSVFAMKIDIEGYEPMALEGARRLMKNHAPCIVNIEEKFSGEQTRDLFQAAGYIKREPHPDPDNDVDSWYERLDFDACVASL